MSVTAKPMVAVITGAGRGLGLEFVRQLSNRDKNAIVIGTVRSASGANNLQQLAKANSNIKIVEVDVSSDASVAKLAEQIKRHTEYIDVLINNSGISSNGDSDPRRQSVQEIDRVWQTNVLGVHRVTQALYPLVKAAITVRGSVPAPHRTNTKPLIIVISSIIGSIAKNAYVNATAYGVSKAAVNMLSQHWALAGKEDGIIVLPVHPGWVATDMGSSGGRKPPLQPEESIAGMLKLIDSATEHRQDGYYQWDGQVLPW